MELLLVALVVSRWKRTALAAAVIALGIVLSPQNPEAIPLTEPRPRVPRYALRRRDHGRNLRGAYSQALRDARADPTHRGSADLLEGDCAAVRCGAKRRHRSD